MNDNKPPQNGQRPVQPQNGQQPRRDQQNNQQQNNQHRGEEKKYFPKESVPTLLPAAEPAGQKYVSIAIIAFLLGFGAAALWFGDGATGSAGKTATSTPKMATSTTGAVTKNDGTVTQPVMNSSGVVVDNQVAGMSVAIRSITLAEPAWAVVAEAVPGGFRYLGAHKFDKGTTENGSIDLLRGTTAGRTYSVVIRTENGDGEFIPRLDLPLLDGAGKEVGSSFVALEL